MNKASKYFAWIVLYLFFSVIAFPSVAQNGNDKSKTVFWGNAGAFLNRQAECSLNLINQSIEEYPPVEGQPLIRKSALYNLDAILHETKYDQSPELHQFMATRITSALDKMSQPVKGEMEIYKLYNDGFVVRTNTVTFAFDLYRGDSLVPDSLMQAVVDKCDILFISHIHRDHADLQVAEMFIKEGKPVWGPTNLWENNKDIYHIRSEKVIEKTVTVRGKKLIVKVLPGHQDDLMNNVYNVITPEGFSVVHTGDQYNENDMEWIAQIKKQVSVLDVLLVNCWTLRLKEFVDDFDPQLVITGHENEMGHTIDHREPYWLSFQKLGQINKPYVLMTWGEHYKYTR
jgi:L-ascorbate metabolism protein UlaG (beta-lactamase superfamily)